MKARIFLYLFVFALMYAIFEFINSKRYAEAKEKEINQLEQQLYSVEADLESYKIITNSADQDFSLKSNPNAKAFFEDQDIDIDSLSAEIENKIISQNQLKKDNPLVPYSGTDGRVMKINRIHIINNRWIIAEFTDGIQWGEALISYFIDDQNQLQFDTKDGVLYDEM